MPVGLGLVPEAAVHARHGLAGAVHAVQLDVLDGVAQRASATLTDGEVAVHLDHRLLVDARLGVAAETAAGVLKGRVEGTASGNVRGD